MIRLRTGTRHPAARAALGLIAAAGFALLLFAPARAAVSPSPCPGNVCTGTVTVGGQSVQYAYTQHLRPGGELKIRLNGGVYSTASIVSFIIHDMPAFTSWGEYANPHNGAVILPEEDVNPGRTAYERKDSDGCASCIVDQVMTVTYPGIAAGSYTFDLTVIQNGDTGGLTDLEFFVDAGAPLNDDESDAWVALAGMDLPCADGVDNDVSYDADCADTQCAGSVGRVAPEAFCQQPESTCYDDFDNDADGLIDCLDPDCDGLVGDDGSGALCQFGNEWGGTSCGDNFDNDGDGRTDCVDNLSTPSGTPSLTCWKQAGYGCPATEISCDDGVDNDKDQSYSDDWDDAPLTGRDCQDYDCAGDPACPAQENKTAGGADADAQCFNGIDDDLDGLIDCSDPDCLGVVNPGNPSQICYEKEFDLGQRYQFCGNSFDDDGDAAADCLDTDCARKFGSCGPCPSREDYTYDACADGTDNDTDGGADCSDPDGDCDGSPGTLGHAARCSADEAGADACFDLFDNDNDGLVDCADPGCVGAVGPNGRTCEATETTCSEPGIQGGWDNDGDGAINCADGNCWGVADCAPKSWTNAACQIVPRATGFSSFTSNNATVTVSVREAAHVEDEDEIRLVGTGTYSSLTVIIGDNTDPSAYYPYADPTCTLTGTNASQLAFISVPGRVVQIYNDAGATVSGFDVTFTCDTLSAPAAERSYPVSLSALKTPGDVAEYGDLEFDHTLWEATVPTVTEVEGEGEDAGTMEVPYGGTRRFRAVPNEPGTGLDASGVCGCTVRIDGADYLTADGDCLTNPLLFYADADSVNISGNAEDGANNTGSFGGSRSVAVNVTPVNETALTLLPSPPLFNAAPFFNATYDEVDLFAEFRAASNDTFGTSCYVYIRDADTGAIVNGPVGPTMSFSGTPVGNFIRCNAGLTVPSMPDGDYYVTVSVTDGDGDVAESNRKLMYRCDSVPSAGDPETVCSWADFDRDGSSEGMYTTLYSTAPKACDNCVGLANPLQTDENANGVGDACEPNDEYGRCEYDRDIVCRYDSDDPLCPGDLCCSDPAISDPSEPATPPHLCRDPWGLCSLGGEICFEDSECPGGDGLCGDDDTACRRDIDCDVAGVAGPCAGADICDNLVFPWLETVHGNIFSGKKILAPDTPPDGRFNATYCIAALDTVLNFESELCTAEGSVTSQYQLPDRDNAFSGVLGRIDVAGLKAGKYGPVTTVTSSGLDAALSAMANPLDGRVIVVDDGGDATVTGKTFFNALGTADGSGTVLIDGGDLYVTGDMTYAGSTVTSLTQLASIGWIVIPDEDGLRGNVFVDGAVQELVGAFFIGGLDGFHSVTPPSTDSDVGLTVSGLMIARKFNLSRSLKSVDRGSEQIIYDGRPVANPPPGFGDVGRSLPFFTDTP